MKKTIYFLTSLALVFLTIEHRGLCAPQGEFTDEAQITALEGGKLESLKAIQPKTPVESITVLWTEFASRKLHSKRVNVSRSSALLTAEFIRKGAAQFVAAGSPKDRVEEAQKNLERLISKMLEIGEKEDGKIGESTFGQAQNSLCPLWPFC